ncbi:unnamed protein product [Periconia digitata]|uniref:Mediator of RNA polymerase II transcription subunit 18 n=1 Tax=Periconia digitata TaxID=1303443 RepID=A0A9W4ULV3_9PLEO|nr:unnamed protein product [Periconia digitata]
MHELLLYGQVPLVRHDQVLKILAGVAAMQPRRVCERRILYKPTKKPDEPGAHLSRRGGTQNVAGKPPKQAGSKDLFYQQVVQTLSDNDFGKDSGQTLSADVKPGQDPKWALEFYDLPDTGDRGVSIRQSSSTSLLSGDPHAWMAAAGPHRYVAEYYLEGHRFVHGNVVIFLHRILHQPGVRARDSPVVQLPAYDALQLVDPSGAYILEAKVRVHDFNQTAVMDSAVREIVAFQEQMKGCVELALPDRLALDTRVKWKPPPPPPAMRPR